MTAFAAYMMIAAGVLHLLLLFLGVILRHYF